MNTIHNSINNDPEKEEYKLCIILVNYHNYTDTIRCIESINRSDLNFIPSIIVVDNESNEDDLQKLNNIDGINVIPLSENVGYGQACNVAIKWALSNGDYNQILLLNNDTILKRDTLRLLLEGVRKYPDIKIFSPIIVTMENNPHIWYDGAIFNFWKMTPVINNIGLCMNSLDNNDSYTYFVSGCAFLFSPGILLDDEDLFDPVLFMYDEDFEFSIRMQKEGFRMMKLGNALLYHKCQGSQNNANLKKKINQLSPGNPNLIFYLENTIPNRYYIIEKHFRGIRKIMFNLSVTTYWLLKSAQYLINLNFRGGYTVIKAILIRIFKGIKQTKMN